MTALKICGLQPGDDLRFAEHPAVTHVGIVFAPNSRRYVQPKRAAAMVHNIDGDAQVMGVFVDTPPDEVLRIAEGVGLHGVQLHGREDSETCRRLREAGYQVWKALSVPAERTGWVAFQETLRQYQDCVDALLLDAPPPGRADTGVTGGFGVRFDWTALSTVIPAQHELPPVWIAGGLTPDNVGQLLSTFRPVGVDVSSGVEVNGRKSPEKIQAMIKAVCDHV